MQALIAFTGGVLVTAAVIALALFASRGMRQAAVVSAMAACVLAFVAVAAFVRDTVG